MKLHQKLRHLCSAALLLVAQQSHAGLVQQYSLDGSLIDGFANPAPLALAAYADSGKLMAINGHFAPFFTDEYIHGTQSADEVDYIRSFDTGLTESDAFAPEAPARMPRNDIPEPATGALVFAGLGLLGLAHRRQMAARRRTEAQA